MALNPSSKVGPYEIIAPVGAGGMGEVYKAKDNRLQRTVAIKVLPAELAGNADRLTRFQQEARSASALNHPNIVTIYEIGSVDSVNFISMEFVEGKSLREIIQTSGALPTRRFIQIASQLADGLAKAHAAGIVHRDLKPENIMISKDGVVKILDFGLAKLIARNSDEEHSLLQTQTNAGAVLGTVGYMSPEQASGASVDFRSDQFSFGAMLYEMATGKRAFQRATTAETMAAIIRDEPEPLSATNTQIPAPLRWIMERCLAKDPEDRFASTRDLARDLQSIRDHISDITSSATADWKGVQAPAHKRSPLLWILPLVLLAFLAGGAAHWKFFRPPARKPMAIRALTYSGSDSEPSVSSDGRLVAFTSKRDGHDRIWLRQMAGGDEVALTAGTDGYARFSADGSNILFTRTENGRSSLYRIPALGGEPRKIVDDAGFGDWSPDGKQIVFVRIDAHGSVQNSTIYIADADGTHIQSLARVTNTILQLPRWSPDGSQIAASVYPLNNYKIEKPIIVIDLKTKAAKWLPVFATGYTSAVGWTADSKNLLYEEQEIPILGDRGIRPGNFLLQDVRSGKIRTMFWFPSMATSIERTTKDQLIFDGATTRGNLREIPITTDLATAGITMRWLTRGNSNDRQPKYSPDGEWIIFSSDRNGNLDLWKLSTKNGTVRRMTEDAAQDWDPTFTPDGKQILWSSNRGGHFEIYLADADGSGAHQLSNDGVDAENPSETPDGKWIVYGSFNPAKAGIWKIRPDGSGATQVLKGVIQIPELSPDGKYVSVGLFQRSIAEGSVTLEVLRLEDGAHFALRKGIKQSLTDILGARSRWFPDGKRIAYMDVNEQGAYGVYVQDFDFNEDSNSSRKPLAGFDTDSPIESFGLSPDGSRITVSEREGSAGLVLAENAPLD